MAKNTRPIQFRDYLPEVFRADEVQGVSFLSKFLQPFETLFEELEAEIEGMPGGILQLTVEAVTSTTITVAAFNSVTVEFPVGTPVTGSDRTKRTTLKQAIPANRSGLTQIEVEDASFVAALQTGDILSVYPGGIPDLFNPDTTPPPQFTHRPQPDFDYLNYLASWIALPLRAEKSESFNRAFFDAAIPLYTQRSTLPGMDALLREWLKGDLLETDPLLLVLTDLTRTYNDVDTIFQLAPERDEDRKSSEIYAQIGLNAVLGEGPPFFFIADLIANPKVLELRNPLGLDVFERAARFLLDAEKPAFTYYQLRVRTHTMQLPEPGQTTIDGRPGAQIGETTLLWEEPQVFDSDC